MVEALIGTWKLHSSENFDDFLKELGVGFVLRKLAGSINPTIEIVKNGDEWIMKTTTIRTSESKFKIGEEFEEDKPDGSKDRSTVTIDGDKLVQESDNNGKHYRTTREVVDGKLKVTIEAGNVTCIRIFVPA